MEQISNESYDYADMEETLEMVEGNVSDNPIVETEPQTEPSIDSTGDVTQETEENILDNTNEDIFGEGVIIGSTTEPQTEAPETIAPETEAPEMTEPQTEDPFGLGEVQEETYNFTEPETTTPADAVRYTEDQLTQEEDKQDYQDTMEFFDKLLYPDQIVEEGDYKVYLPQEVADELKDDIGQRLLDLMINGVVADTLEYDEETAVYQNPELEDIVKFVRDLLKDDKKELMPDDVTTEDKEFLYQEAKEWFEDLYDYVPAGETAQTETQTPETTGEQTSLEGGTIDLGPVEEQIFVTE